MAIEAEIQMSVDVDVRRSRPLEVTWNEDGPLIGSIRIDGKLWASVEWSESRQAWCIEDAQGACLAHTDHIRGQEASQVAALALAKAMIADGRMPSPEDALAQRLAARRVRSQDPKNVRAREKAGARRFAQRQREAALSNTEMYARWADEAALPLWEAMAEAFDFSDPMLWRSNSFSSLRPRLVLYLRRVVAQLELQIEQTGKRHKPWNGHAEPADRPKARVAALAPKLAKAREILGFVEESA